MEPAEVIRTIEEVNLSAEKRKKVQTRKSANKTGSTKRSGARHPETVKKVARQGNARRVKKSSLQLVSDSHATVGVKRKNRWKYLLPVLLILLLGIGAGSGYYIWYQSFTEISLAKQTSLVMSGYDGKGSVALSLETLGEYKEFFDQVETSISKATDLSNGDELQISYTYDPDLAKKMKLRVDGEPVQLTVEGLAIPTRISTDQLFEAVKLTTEDLSPMIRVTMENVSEDSFLQAIPFEIVDEKPYYANGDEVTVRATIDEDLALQYAYAFEGDLAVYEKTYQISSEEAYVTDPGAFTEEQLEMVYRNGAKYFDAAHAKEYGLRLFSEAHLNPQWANKQTFFSWVNPRVISAYFNVVSEQGKELLETHVNDLKVVYEATLTQPDGQACNAEVVVQYTDLKELADGSIDFALDSGKIIGASIRNTNIKNMVYDTDDGNYISTKLK